MIKAVSIAFLLNGILFGAWVSRVSYFKVSFELDERQISTLFLLLAFGAICAFIASPKLCAKLSASNLTIYSALSYAIAFLMIGWSSSYILFTLAVFLFGTFHGAMDVAMNTWASELESQHNKRFMPKLHAVFSLGAGVGAASAIPMISWSLAPYWHFSLLLVILLPLSHYLAASLTSSVNNYHQAHHINIKKFALPNKTLLLIALIACGTAFGEGAIADWSSVYMFQQFNENHMFGALAYSIFSAAMVISRFTADQLLNLLGTIKSVELCAVASCIGTLLLISTQSLTLCLVGFALLGFGFSIIMPLAFSKAAKIDNIDPSTAIATVASFAYGGMLLGPVIIGAISQNYSLKIAFSLFAFIAIFTFFTASKLSENSNELSSEQNYDQSAKQNNKTIS